VKAKIGFATFLTFALMVAFCSPYILRAQAAAQAPAAQAAGAGKTPAQKEPPPPPPAPMQPVTAPTQDSTNDLTVTVGKSVVLDLARPVNRIAVGSAEVAEATAVSPTQVLINGKAQGETSVIVWDVVGGRQFFNVTVRPSTLATSDKLDGIRRQLRTELPGQTFKLTEEGGTLFLRGTVNDLTSSDRAVAIASTAGKVVNLLNVTVPASEPQILLKVRFLSVDRSKARSFGMNLYSTGTGNTVGSVSTGQFSAPSVSLPSGSTAATATADSLNLNAYYSGIGLGVTIKALEEKGLSETLAEPNLLAANGKQASFLAGGEYPYPMVQGSSGGVSGAVSIMFKQYGVRLNFIPTITPRGTIRLQVAPEVSALDFANAVTISGFTEPAITVRRVKTEVELENGQSFVIGGLLDNRETETFQKIPFIGDIPILGKFFQTQTRKKTNTELIVTVTPEIVSPLPVGVPLPELKMPQPFLEPSSNIPMHQPVTKSADSTKPPTPVTIPVEKLIESMKPGPQLQNTDSGSGSSSGGMTTSSSSSTGP
jgi:pilus assembly protein CpaC